MNTNDTISLDVDIGGYGIELSSIADQPWNWNGWTTFRIPLFG
jgi:hypothetical protein